MATNDRASVIFDTTSSGNLRAGMAADALSDVLRTIRLTGATFFHVIAKAKSCRGHQ